MATDIALAKTVARGDNAVLIVVRLPDETRQDQLLSAAREQLEALQAAETEAKGVMESLKAQPGIANYLTIAGKVRRQELVLTAEQKAAFLKLREKVGPVLKELARQSEAATQRTSRREQLEVAMAGVETEREASRRLVRCKVAEIGCELIVRSRAPASDEKPLGSLTATELRALLRTAGKGGQRIFLGSSGSLDWCLAATAES